MPLSSNLTQGEVVPVGGSKTPAKFIPTPPKTPAKFIPNNGADKPIVNPENKPTVTPTKTPVNTQDTPVVTNNNQSKQNLLYIPNPFQQKKDEEILKKKQEETLNKEFFKNPDKIVSAPNPNDLFDVSQYSLIYLKKYLEEESTYGNNHTPDFSKNLVSVNNKLASQFQLSDANSAKNSQKYLEDNGVNTDPNYLESYNKEIDLKSLEYDFKVNKDELNNQVTNSGFLSNLKKIHDIYNASLAIKKKIEDKESVFNSSDEKTILETYSSAINNDLSKIKEIENSDIYKKYKESIPIIKSANEKFNYLQDYFNKEIKPLSLEINDFVSSKGKKSKSEDGNTTISFSNNEDLIKYNELKYKYDLAYGSYSTLESEVNSILNSEDYKSYFSEDTTNTLNGYNDLILKLNDNILNFNNASKSFNNLISSDEEYNNLKSDLTKNINLLDKLAKYKADDSKDLVSRVITKYGKDILDKEYDFNDALNKEIRYDYNEKKYNSLLKYGVVGEIPKNSEKEILYLLMSEVYINSPSIRKKAYLTAFYNAHKELYKGKDLSTFLEKYNTTVTPSAELILIKSSAKKTEKDIGLLYQNVLNSAKTGEAIFVNGKRYDGTQSAKAFHRLKISKDIIKELNNLDFESFSSFKDNLRKTGKGLSSTSLSDWIPFLNGRNDLSENKLIYETVNNVDLKSNEYKTKGGFEKLGISKEEYLSKNLELGEYELYKSISSLNSYNSISNQGFSYQLGKSVFPNLIVFMGEMAAMNYLKLGSLVPSSIQRTTSLYGAGMLDMAEQYLPKIVNSGFVRYGTEALTMSPEVAKSFSTIFSIVPKASILGQPSIVAETYRRMTDVNNYYFSTESGEIIDSQIEKGQDPATAYLKSYLQYNMEAMTEQLGTALQGANAGNKVVSASKKLIDEIVEQSAKLGAVSDDLITKFSSITKIPFDKAKIIISAFGNKSLKPFINRLIYNDISKSLTKNFGKAFNPKNYLRGGISEFFEKAGVNGMAYEYIEEFVSNRLSPLIEGSKDEFWLHPLDNQFEEFKQTTAALSPLILFGVGTGSVGASVDLYRYGKEKISKYNSVVSDISNASSEVFEQILESSEKDIESLKRSGKSDLYIKAKEILNLRKRYEALENKEMTFQEFQNKIVDDSNKINELISDTFKKGTLDLDKINQLKTEVTEKSHLNKLDYLLELNNDFESNRLNEDFKHNNFFSYLKSNEKEFNENLGEMMLFTNQATLPNFSKWQSYIDNSILPEDKRDMLKEMYHESVSFYEENKGKMSFVNNFELSDEIVVGNLSNSKSKISIKLLDGKYEIDSNYSKKELVSLMSRDLNLANISSVIKLNNAINNLKSPLSKKDSSFLKERMSARLVSQLENIDTIDESNISLFNNIISLLNKNNNSDLFELKNQIGRIITNQSKMISSSEDLIFNGKLFNSLLANDNLFDYDFVKSLTNKIDFSLKERENTEEFDSANENIEDAIERLLLKSKNIKVSKSTLELLRKNKSFNILESKLNDLEKNGDITKETKNLLIKTMQYLPTDLINFEDIEFDKSHTSSYYDVINNKIYIANNSSQGVLIFEAVEEIIHSVYFNLLKGLVDINSGSLLKDSFVQEVSERSKSQLLKSITGFYNNKNYSYDRYILLSNKNKKTEEERDELDSINQMLSNFKTTFKLKGKRTEIDFIQKDSNGNFIAHYTTESLIKSFNRFNFFMSNNRGYDFKQSIYFASDMKEFFARTMSDYLLNKISEDSFGKGFKSVSKSIKKWCYKNIIAPVTKVLINDSIVDENKSNLVDFIQGKIDENDYLEISQLFDNMSKNSKESQFKVEIDENDGTIEVIAGSVRKKIRSLRIEPDYYINSIQSILENNKKDEISTLDAIKIFIENKGISFEELNKELNKSVINNDLSFLSEIQDFIVTTADLNKVNRFKIANYFNNPRGLTEFQKKFNALYQYQRFKDSIVDGIDLLDEESLANFKKWFGDNNYFQTEDGNPIIKYHYSDYGNFKEQVFDKYKSDFGIHLGTFYQAADRAVIKEFNYLESDYSDTSNIIGFALNIKNPLVLKEDLGVFDESSTMRIISNQLYGDVRLLDRYREDLDNFKDNVISLISKLNPNSKITGFQYSLDSMSDTPIVSFYVDGKFNEINSNISFKNNLLSNYELSNEQIDFLNKYFSVEENNAERDIAHNIIKELGYDSIVYQNNFEGEQSRDFEQRFEIEDKMPLSKETSSVIVFEPNNVKAVKINRGTFDDSANFARSVRKSNTEVINGFYSPLENIVNETKSEKLPVKQWLDKFAKGEEAKWTGLADWLNNQQGSIYKSEIQNFLKENRIEIKEIVGSENESNLPSSIMREKITSLQLDGKKENYKEVLVTLPFKSNLLTKSESEEFNILEQKLNNSNIEIKEFERYKELNKKSKNFKGFPKFKSYHFEESNILFHIRMNTRTDADGNKVLFLEELQSDWGQQGKKKGFKNNLIENKEYDLVEKAPFVTDTNAWVKLGLKVALKEAVKQDVDKIAWTTGEQQNDRYELRKQVDEIGYSYIPETNNYRVVGGKNGINLFNSELKESELESNLGKDVTNKIISNKESSVGKMNFLRGDDISVGGKGMKGFYGSPTEGSLGIVGSVAKSLFKQEPSVLIINKEKTESLKSFELFKDEISKKYNFDKNERFSVLLKNNGTKEEIEKYVKLQNQYTIELASVSGKESYQHSIDVTKDLKNQVEDGIPVFSTRKAQNKDFYNEVANNITDPLKSSQNKIKAIKNLIFNENAKELPTNIKEARLINNGFINESMKNSKISFLNKLSSNEEFNYDDTFNNENTLAFSRRKNSSNTTTPVGTISMNASFFQALKSLKGTGKIDSKLIGSFLDLVKSKKSEIDNYRQVARNGVELWLSYYISENAEKIGITKRKEIQKLSRLTNRNNISDYKDDVYFFTRFVENHNFRKLVLDVKNQQRISFNKSIRDFNKDVDFYNLLKKLSSVEINLFKDSDSIKEYNSYLKSKPSSVDLKSFEAYVNSVLEKQQSAFIPSSQKSAVDENAIELERNFKINQINFFKNFLIKTYGKNKLIRDFLSLDISELSLASVNKYQEALSHISTRGSLNQDITRFYLKIKADQLMEDFKSDMDKESIKMINAKVTRNAIRDYFSKLGNVSYFSLKDLVDFIDGQNKEYSGKLVKSLINPIEKTNREHKKIYQQILKDASLLKKNNFTEEEFNLIGIYGTLNQLPSFEVKSSHLLENNKEDEDSLGGILFQAGVSNISPGEVLTYLDLNSKNQDRQTAYKAFLSLTNKNIKESIMISFGEVPDGYTQEEVDKGLLEQSRLGKNNKSIIGKSELEKFKKSILSITNHNTISDLVDDILNGNYKLDSEKETAYNQIINAFEKLSNGSYTDGIGLEYVSKNYTGLDFENIKNYFPLMRTNDFEKFDDTLLSDINGIKLEQEDNFYLITSGFNLNHSFLNRRKQVAMSLNLNSLDLFRLRTEQQLFYILNEPHRQFIKKVFDDGFFGTSTSEHSLDGDTSEFLKSLFNNHFNRGISKGYVEAMNSEWLRIPMKVMGAYQVQAVSALYKAPSQLSTIVNSMMAMKGSNTQRLSALKFGIKEVFSDLLADHKKWDDILIEHMPSVYFRAVADYNLQDVKGIGKPVIDSYKSKNLIDGIFNTVFDDYNSKQISLYFVSLFDRISARVCAISSYKNYLDVNNIPLDYSNIDNDAIEFAINAVNQTQASDDLINKPAISQGIYASKNAQSLVNTGIGYLLSKSFLAFQSFSINETRLVRKERAGLINSIKDGNNKQAFEHANNLAINLMSRFIYQYMKRLSYVGVPLAASFLLNQASGQDDEENNLGYNFFEESNYLDRLDFDNVSLQILLDYFGTVKPMYYGVAKLSQFSEEEIKGRELTEEEKMKYLFTDSFLENFYQRQVNTMIKTPKDVYKDYFDNDKYGRNRDYLGLEDASKMILQYGTLGTSLLGKGFLPGTADLFDLVKEVRKQKQSALWNQIETEKQDLKIEDKKEQ